MPDLAAQLSRKTALPDISALHMKLLRAELTSVQLTRHCLVRIDASNPDLHAVLAVNPAAIRQARQADRRYAAGRWRSRLDGIPVMVKDNIDTGGLAGTAGSRLLDGHPPSRNAEIVTLLRRAGAVILGKTNLSEWSNFRSTRGIEGWSAVGGQTRNPHRVSHSPGGSSSGSAVAVSAGMAPLALGTETDGSIVAPAGLCGVVGVKPEFGLLPAGGIVPISTEMDTVGLLAARVCDAALALEELGGIPSVEPARGGLRLGLWLVPGMAASLGSFLSGPVESLRRAGATVVPVKLAVDRQLLRDGLFAMYAEFRPSVESYLRTRTGVPQTLAELCAANRADPAELQHFGQDLFDRALEISAAERARATSSRRRAARNAALLICDTLRRYRIDAVIAPTNEPPTRIDYALGERGSAGSSTVPALAGYPAISVPVARSDEDLPVGLSVFGPATLPRLLAIAAAVEQWCAPPGASPGLDFVHMGDKRCSNPHAP